MLSFAFAGADVPSLLVPPGLGLGSFGTAVAGYFVISLDSAGPSACGEKVSSACGLDVASIGSPGVMVGVGIPELLLITASVGNPLKALGNILDGIDGSLVPLGTGPCVGSLPSKRTSATEDGSEGTSSLGKSVFSTAIDKSTERTLGGWPPSDVGLPLIDVVLLEVGFKSLFPSRKSGVGCTDSSPFVSSSGLESGPRTSIIEGIGVLLPALSESISSVPTGGVVIVFTLEELTLGDAE